MENCGFTLGNRIFRQVISISMGYDPAPLMVDLFLYFNESKWLKELRKKNLYKARKFDNTLRFIDDLNSINDDGFFEAHCKEIYPPELVLKKSMEVSSLDLDISLSNKQFSLSFFDKRNDFPFSIVRMPFSNSSMPSNIFSTIKPEILRIG